MTDEINTNDNFTIEENVVETNETTNKSDEVNAYLKEKIDKRNSTLDIIRICSVLLVMMVHFFLHTGFYSEPMIGGKMFIMCFMRTFFSTCVPMFILLSGYLMSKKTLSKKYFFGISKTLLTYFMAGVACIIFKSVHLNQTYTFKSIILSFLDFSSANYAWYIEMYIGLFLLIPFLNLIYNNLKTHKQKALLVLVMVLLTAVPTLFNVYNLNDPSWWATPSMNSEFNKIFPSWWIGFYPVTFYFTGCYLKEFGLNLKTKTVAFLLLLTTLGFTAFNFWRSYGTGFITSQYAYWYGFQPYVSAVLLFELLGRIKCDKTSYTTRYILWKVSDLVLCMYLVSYIFDELVYAYLRAKVPVMQDRIWWFIPCVLCVFIGSLSLSFVIHFLEIFLKVLYNSIKEFITKLREKSDLKVVDFCFFVLLTLGIIFSIWKVKYGFGGNDEAFYLTVAHRLGLSDTLFMDEWHLSQMTGFLLMPLVWLFRTITGSTDGILLTFRVLYLIMHALVVIFAYKRLRKYGYVAAIGLALYFFYTPYNIMALSYNTLALDLLLVCGLLVSTKAKRPALNHFLSGLCLAAAVLCCPYLVIVYVAYLLCVIAQLILKDNISQSALINNEMFSLRTFLWFTLGVSTLAVIFAVFLALTCGFKAVVDNLPLMLLDPEHPQIGMLAKLKAYFTSIYNCHNRFKILFFTYIGTLACMTLDRNRKNHRAFYLIISAILTIVCLFMFYPKVTSSTYNHIMMPMIFVGITSYILCDKKPKAIFAGVFMIGILYSICITMSSNQYFYVISMAWSVTNVASFVFLAQLLKELKARPDDFAYGKVARSLAIITVAVTVFILGIMQIKAKHDHCFWESDINSLTHKISDGPAKGLYTTEANASVYEAINADLDYYENLSDDDILMLTERTWCYLKVNDMPYGSFSAWISGENETALDRLELFYSVNPDKIPEYIYIPKASKLDTATIASTATAHSYQLIENEVSYKLAR